MGHGGEFTNCTVQPSFQLVLSLCLGIVGDDVRSLPMNRWLNCSRPIRISRQRLECGAFPRFLARPNTRGSWPQSMILESLSLPMNQLKSSSSSFSSSSSICYGSWSVSAYFAYSAVKSSCPKAALPMNRRIPLVPRPAACLIPTQGLLGFPPQPLGFGGAQDSPALLKEGVSPVRFVSSGTFRRIYRAGRFPGLRRPRLCAHAMR